MPTILEQIQYGFDCGNRRTWQRRALSTTQDQHYSYDALSQVNAAARGRLNLNLTAISGVPAAQESWDYDPTGNWRGYHSAANGVSTLDQHRVHDRGNRLTQIEDNPNNMILDRVGRMRQMAPDADGDWDGKLELTWDAWSRITSVKNNGTVVGEYAYDGTHRRVTREVEGVTLHSYYNDAWRPVEERKDAETTASISYLWGARHRDDLVRRDRAVDGTTLNESRYVLMDYFNPASITDEEGEVTERYAFSAFGVRTILNPDFTARSSSECGMEFAFQGQFLDTESGLMNYGYRYYSPNIGRWTCKDPIGIDGGLNLYAVSNNGMINQVDFFGLVAVDFTPADENPGTWLVSKTQSGSPMETAYDGDSWCECNDSCKLECFAYIDATIYQDEDWKYPFSRPIGNKGKIPIDDASGVYGHEQAHIRARNEEVEHKLNQAVKDIPTDHASKSECESDRGKAEQAMEGVIARLRNGNLSPSHPGEPQKPGMDPLWPGKNRPPFDGIPMKPVLANQ